MILWGFFLENTRKNFKLILVLVLVLKSKALYYEFDEHYLLPI